MPGLLVWLDSTVVNAPQVLIAAMAKKPPDRIDAACMIMVNNQLAACRSATLAATSSSIFQIVEL